MLIDVLRYRCQRLPAIANNPASSGVDKLSE